MDKLIELLQQIQELAGVAIDALQSASGEAGGGAEGGGAQPPAEAPPEQPPGQ